jgi:hypothetical protein
MMDEEYPDNQIINDMEYLRRLGLIEVVGMNADGEWLWGATSKGHEVSSRISNSSLKEETLRILNEESANIFGDDEIG